MIATAGGCCCASCCCASAALASEAEHAVERKYVTAPPSPASQSDEAVQTKSAGCLTCHTQTDANTMHLNPAVKLGCTDCHGGNSAVRLTGGAQRGSDALHESVRIGARAAALSGVVALPVERQSASAPTRC